jgi:hypothetical protein
MRGSFSDSGVGVSVSNCDLSELDARLISASPLVSRTSYNAL